MVTLPNARKLLTVVKRALNCAGECKQQGRVGWASAVGSALEKGLEKVEQRLERGHLECCFASKGGNRPKEEREFLFDFSALYYEEPKGASERYFSRALISGELEFHSKIDDDFERLLLSNAVLCFFVFPKTQVMRGDIQSKMNSYSRAIRRQRRYARSSGEELFPKFLLSCWFESHGDDPGKFIHRVV